MNHRIEYITDHNTVASGYVAEMADSPLTGSLRIRVVDFISEIDDPDAGKWIDPHKVIDDGQPKSTWLHSPAN